MDTPGQISTNRDIPGQVQNQDESDLSYGELIRAQRIARKWTFEDLARQTKKCAPDNKGISTKTIERLENEEHRPTDHSLARVARALDMSLQVLLDARDRNPIKSNRAFLLICHFEMSGRTLKDVTKQVEEAARRSGADLTKIIGVLKRSIEVLFFVSVEDAVKLAAAFNAGKLVDLGLTAIEFPGTLNDPESEVQNRLSSARSKAPHDAALIQDAANKYVDRITRRATKDGQKIATNIINRAKEEVAELERQAAIQITEIGERMLRNAEEREKRFRDKLTKILIEKFGRAEMFEVLQLIGEVRGNSGFE